MSCPRFDGSGGSLLVVNGTRWKWKVGDRSVVAYSADGKKRLGKKRHIVGSRKVPSMVPSKMALTGKVAAWLMSGRIPTSGEP